MANLVAAETILELERFLPYRLAVLASNVSRGLAQIHGGHGLESGEWFVLMMLGGNGPMTATALCRAARMHKTAVSRAVSGLLRQGLILRQANPIDMREAFLQLSAPGREVYSDSVQRALDLAGSLINGISPEELAALDRSLNRLAKSSQRLAIDPFAVVTKPRG